MVDVRAHEVAGEQVADDPQRQLGFLVDQLRRLRLLGARLNRLPEPLQEDEVALDVLGRGALGGGADDDPALLDVEPLNHVLQPISLRVVEAPGHAQAFPVGDVDEEPPGERDLRRQPRALGLHRVLDGLYEQLLAARDQVLDLLAVPLPLELRDHDLVDVQEAVLLEPDLDERRLHPREDVVDDAEVDVAGDRAALRPLEVHLGDLLVLEHRDALLTDVDRDDQLTLGRRQRRTPRCWRRRVRADARSRVRTLAAFGALLRPCVAARTPSRWPRPLSQSASCGCAHHACRGGVGASAPRWSRPLRPVARSWSPQARAQGPRAAQARLVRDCRLRGVALLLFPVIVGTKTKGRSPRGSARANAPADAGAIVAQRLVKVSAVMAYR